MNYGSQITRDFKAHAGSSWVGDRNGVVARHVAAVFGWMGMATGLTGFVAYILSGFPSVLAAATSTTGGITTFIVSLVLLYAIMAKARDAQMSGDGRAAIFYYLLFATLWGVMLTPIFALYTIGSVATTFFTCTLTFGFFACFGMFTGINLLRFGGFLFMALIGILISEVMLMFSMWLGWMSPEGNMLWYHLSSAAGILLFIALIAYDSQRLKYDALEGRTTVGHQISAALGLYLDFINLFLFFLRIFGVAKSD